MAIFLCGDALQFKRGRHGLRNNKKDNPLCSCSWSESFKVRNLGLETQLDFCQTFDADGVVTASGNLKPNKGLVTRLGHCALVQKRVKGREDGRQWPEVARCAISDGRCQLACEILGSSECKVFRLGWELDIKCSGGVCKRAYGEPSRFSDWSEELVNLVLEHLSTERSTITCPLNCFVEPMGSVYALLVKLRHYPRQNPVRNWSYGTAVPIPAIGRWTYFKCTMDWITGVRIGNRFLQFLLLPDCANDLVGSCRKLTRRHRSFEASTRSSSTNKNSLLKSIESDVDVC